MATNTNPTAQDSTLDLVIKALKKICYNETGLDITIAQIESLNVTPVTPSQPVEPASATDNSPVVLP